MSAMLRSRQFWVSFVLTLAVCVAGLLVVRGQSDAASSHTHSPPVADARPITVRTADSTAAPPTLGTTRTTATATTSTQVPSAGWVDGAALRAAVRRVASATGAGVG